MKRALIYGANGALGRAVCSAFLAPHETVKWDVVGIDIKPNQELEHNILISPDLGNSLSAQSEEIRWQLDHRLKGKEKKFDSLICVSGGFAMGDAKDPNLLKTVHDMYSSSVYPSFISAHLAANYMKPNGLLVLPGAAVAGATPTPWGLAYGSAKAAVHHMVQSMADPAGSGFPDKTTVIGIAPITLDTPGNREAMVDADRSSWTPLEDLSLQLRGWAEQPTHCTSGTVYKVVTFENQQTTEYIPM